MLMYHQNQQDYFIERINNLYFVLRRLTRWLERV